MSEFIYTGRKQLWAVVLGLSPIKDGNQWSILWGPNIQEGVAAFADTPEECLFAFERAMREKIAAPIDPDDDPEGTIDPEDLEVKNWTKVDMCLSRRDKGPNPVYRIEIPEFGIDEHFISVSGIFSDSSLIRDIQKGLEE